MIARAFAVALCAWALGAISACSSSPSEGACARSADCPSGNLCVSQRCVPASAGCTTDEECGADQRCGEGGSCVARTTDASAGAPDATGPGAPDASPGAPDGDTTDGALAPDGTTPGDDAGAPGDDAAVGAPDATAPACTTDQQCTPPSSICLGNACVAGCVQNPALCGANEVCNTTTGRCTAIAAGCAMDSECGPPARVCEGRQCVPGCGQAGGVQCAPPTPLCSATTGRCTPIPPCARDSDCGNVDQICVNTACVLRCDRPGAPACGANTVCNATDGRCIPGNLALGADCALDSQCQSRLCLGLTIMGAARNVCSVGCSRGNDCPTDFGCLYLSGMNLCLSESLFTPPATFDTPAGGVCQTGNITCQSGWCNTQQSQCIETCQRASDCSIFGGNCFMYTQTPMGSTTNVYDHLCIAQTTSVIGAACAANNTCRTGICNRYTGTCAAHCCSDADCPAAQSCGIYDVDAVTGDIVKICAPRTAGTGSLPLGSPCTTGNQCESELCAPANLTAMNPPQQCSTTCCTNADCGQIPNGRCVPLGGPTVGPVQTIVGVCVSVP